MSDLTPRQTQILRLVQRFISETGMPPTRAEIARELGFRSANAAEEHLRALARKVHDEVELRVRLLGGPGDINRSMTPFTDQASAVAACEKAIADLRRVVDDLLDAAHVHL